MKKGLSMKLREEDERVDIFSKIGCISTEMFSRMEVIKKLTTRYSQSNPTTQHQCSVLVS